MVRLVVWFGGRVRLVSLVGSLVGVVGRVCGGMWIEVCEESVCKRQCTYWVLLVGYVGIGTCGTCVTKVA